MTKKEFVEAARKIYKNTFDYSSVYQENIFPSTNLLINCPKHNAFWQSAYFHLSGYGCPYCDLDKRTKALNREKVGKSV